MKKLKIEPKETEKIFHKVYTKSIRNLTLQKLLLIWFNIWFSKDFPLAKKIRERLKEKGLPTNKTNVVFELKLEEIQEILKCSKRTAYDYLQTLKALNL